MRQGIIKLALLVGIIGAFALAPALANAANHEVFVYETEWDPATLQVDVGDSVTWAVDRNRLGGRETGHDLWVCEGEDVGFEQVQCFWDPSDPEAVAPDNYVGHRAYCGTTNPPPAGECDDGDPSDLTLTFNDPGVYTYLCMIHGQMRGTLTVGSAEPQVPILKVSLKPKKAKTVKRGKSTNITATVKNNGDGEATNVKVCASGKKKLVKVGKCVNVGTIAAGGTAKAKIKVKVKKGKKVKGTAKIKVKTSSTELKTIKGTVKIKIKK